MWGWLQPALEILKEGFVWATSESGLAEMKKRRAGAQLEDAANKAYLAWVEFPTTERWKAYYEAKTALERHSNTP